MRQSDSIDLLALALVAAQGEIGGAVKGSNNPFYKSSYADLNSVIQVLKPVYAKYDLTVIQLPHSDDNGVGVCTRLIHSSGEWLEHSYTLPLSKPDPQAAGSAITYAKRYALKALGLMPDLDDDGEAAMFRTTPEYTEEQKAALLTLLAEGNAFGLRDFYESVGQETMDGLFNSAPKGQKTRFKDEVRALYSAANEDIKLAVAAIQTALSEDSADSVAEVFAEMGELEEKYVNKALSETEHQKIELLRAA